MAASAAEARKDRATETVFRSLGFAAVHSSNGVTTACRITKDRKQVNENNFERASRAEPQIEITVRRSQVPSVTIGDTFTDSISGEVYTVRGINQNDSRVIRAAVR